MDGYHKSQGKRARKNEKKWLTVSLNKLKHYGGDTSLHGFHHVTDEGSSFLKRICFSMICGFSIIFCVYLIWLQLQRYENNIVTTSLTSTAHPVWEVPFPSVIICNNNLVYKSNVEKIIKSLKFNGVPSTILNDFFMNLSSLINLDDVIEMVNYSGVYKTLDRFGYTIDTLMKQLAPPCDKMLKKCYWKTKEVPCLNLFKIVRTSCGYCCGFNQKGFQDEEGDTTISSKVHEYALGAGPAFGLRVILDAEEEEYLSPLKSVIGFWVAVLPSHFFPQMESYGNTLLQADEMTMYLKPTVISSTAEVRRLNYKTRDCFRENEGALRWNSKYSFQVCLLECKARAIEELCRCIPYFLPHKANSSICTYENILCLKQKEYNYNSLAVTASVREKEHLISSLRKGKRCECLPECSSITYDYLTDTAKATAIAGVGYNVTNMSILNVYYKNIECTKMERRVYLTWDSLLASIGGIFGLCLGGSVVSVIECVYYIFKIIEAPVQEVYPKNKKKVHNMKHNKSVETLLFDRQKTPANLALKKQASDKKPKNKTEEYLVAFRN